MLTDTWDNLHGTVIENVDLFNLTLPELILDNNVHHRGKIFLSVFLADMSCGDNVVGGYTGFRHDTTIGVNVIVLVVVCHDMNDGHTLFQTDADMTTLGLMTFCHLDKRILPQRFLNLTGTDFGHGTAQRVEMHFLQNRLDSFCIQEAIHDIVLNIYFDLTAYGSLLSGFVERCDGQYQIGRNGDIEYDNEGFLPVECHRLCSILVIWGTSLSRSPAPRTMRTSKLWLLT